MTHVIEGFAKVKQYDISLCVLFQVLVKFLNEHCQLGLARPRGSKAMLEVIEDLVLIQVFHHIRSNHVL